MNRDEMLKEMGLSEQDFTDLVNKIANLRNSLNASQRAAFDKALPSSQNLARSLSDNCSPTDVESQLGEASGTKGVMCILWARSQS